MRIKELYLLDSPKSLNFKGLNMFISKETESVLVDLILTKTNKARYRGKLISLDYYFTKDELSEIYTQLDKTEDKENLIKTYIQNIRKD